MIQKLLHFLFPTYSQRHHDTIRYAFPLVVIATIFAGLATVSSQNISFVTIRTDAERVSKDEPFYIEVLVTAHVPINAVDLVISYPEARMVVDGIDTGSSVITLWTEEPYVKDGNVYLRGGTFRKGFIGEHTIARIKAHATESGEARILIRDTQLIAGDGAGTIIPADPENTLREARIVVTGAEDGIIEAGASIAVVTDTDNDGDVDVYDIKDFMTAWFTRGSFYDFNGDGRMTIRDFSILLADSFFR